MKIMTTQQKMKDYLLVNPVQVLNRRMETTFEIDLFLVDYLKKKEIKEGK
jgi:hypothetical protein